MQRLLTPLSLLASATLLAACSDSDSGSTAPVEPSGETQSITLDASAGGFGADPTSPANKAAYFNLVRGEVVELSDAQAQVSTDWHVAFKRTNTFFNGGVAGPGNVTSATLATQDDFYNGDEAVDERFFNATPESELEVFTGAVVGEQSFAADTPKPTITSDGGDASWWSYNSTTHTLAAAPDNWSVIRGADGQSYAKMHVTAIDTAARSVTVELFVQGAGSSAFSATPTTWTADLDDAAGGAACFDIDTAAEMDCDSQADLWDLRTEISASGRAWTLWTNGGAYGDGRSGAAMSGLDAATVAGYASAAEVPGFFADAMSNAVKDNAWYAYNLSGNHKLWPNYRVYAVDTGDGIYKIQLTSYYDPAAGTSGHITLRYAEAE